MAEKIRAAGGEIYAISSEPQTLSDRAWGEWKLDFETVGDPHQEIVDGVRDRGWLDLFVNPELDFLIQSSAGRADFTPSHPKGFLQPGVLVLTAEGRVLYRWRGVPTHSNMGGATERPTPEHVWARIEDGLAASPEAGDAVPDEAPPLDSRGVPWPLFCSLLIANGWVLTGRGFGGGLPQAMMAALRLLGFLAAWISAFSFLPTLPVAVALGAWAAFIAPKVRWLGRQFQDVSGSPRLQTGG